MTILNIGFFISYALSCKGQRNRFKKVTKSAEVFENNKNKVKNYNESRSQNGNSKLIVEGIYNFDYSFLVVTMTKEM